MCTNDDVEGCCLLHESIATTTTLLLFLQLHKFKFTKRLEHILQIAFSDAKMDVAHIKPMKRDLTGIAARCLWIASLTIFLGFGKLGNDGDS